MVVINIFEIALNQRISRDDDCEFKSLLDIKVTQGCWIRGTGGHVPPLVFGTSVNPISTGVADYVHQSTLPPPQIFRHSYEPEGDPNSFFLCVGGYYRGL